MDGWKPAETLLSIAHYWRKINFMSVRINFLKTTFLKKLT
jgi:hypothetical protein